MYSKTAALVLILTTSLASALDLKLNSGKIISVEDDSDVTPAKAPLSGAAPVGAISPRQLFGRQTGCYNPNQRVICGEGCCNNNESCCGSRSCGNPSERICCQGGHQCYAGGDCCSDGNCVCAHLDPLKCDPGNYCVKNLRTGRLGCRPYSGSGSSGSDGGDSSSETTRTTTRTTTYTSTSRTTITSAASTTTFTSTSTSTSTTTRDIAAANTRFTCNDDGYLPCPDRKFCCPSGSWCYYNSEGASRCWSRSFYYFYYSYSWSYSFGVRYYTTSTRYDLGGVATRSDVPALSTPPPPSVAPESNPNPTSQRTFPISTTTAGSSIAVGALAGGSVDTSATSASSASSPAISSSTASNGTVSDETTSAANSATPFTPTGNAGATPTTVASSGAEAGVGTHKGVLWLLSLGAGFASLVLFAAG